MKSSHWHPEVLPPGAHHVVAWMSRQTWQKDFYLAGGTALALQLGHRRSVDLDWFTAGTSLDGTHRQQRFNQLRRAPAFQLVEQNDGTIHALIQGVRVSFLRFPYPLLRPLRRWEGVQIADAQDIALMKIGAIIGRGSKKDFMDLFAIITQGEKLHMLFRLAERKFPDVKDFSLQALRALVYFDDAEKDPDPKGLEPSFSWPGIKSHFEREVRKLSHQLLAD